MQPEGKSRKLLRIHRDDNVLIVVSSVRPGDQDLVDGRTDGGCQVLAGLPRQFFLAVTHIQHDAAADRGESDHGDQRGDDQQFCRHPPG